MSRTVNIADIISNAKLGIGLFLFIGSSSQSQHF